MTADEKPRRTADESSAFWRLAGSFWIGKGSWTSWLSLAAVGLFVAWQTHAQVELTEWSRRFFDALAARSSPETAGLPLELLPIAAAYVVAVTGMVVGRMTIQWHWRHHVTRALLDRWLQNNGFLRVDAADPAVGAAESRIVDDVRASVEPLAELGIGFVSNLTSAIAFSIVLASVGGSVNAELAGLTVQVPVYMLIVTVGYAAIISTLTWITGRRLMPLARWRNDAEAKLRAALGSVRENAENIALSGGAPAEARRADDALARLGRAWTAIIARNGLLGLAFNLNGAFFTAVPLIFAAPKALSGALTIGEVAQLVAAFTAVQGALLWVVDNFVRLADCRAAAGRVGTLVLALDGRPQGLGRRAIGPDGEGAPLLTVTDFRPVFTQPGRGCRPLTFSLHAGESILLTGPSGIGKTSLLRALVGIAEPGSGSCALAPDVRMAVVAQRSYLPDGTLRDLVCFPRADHTDEPSIAQALDWCGLGALHHKLDVDQAWNRSLSVGERQRLAFANLMLRDLDLVLLDEATSALDEGAQLSLMTELRRAKPNCAILSIGHRPSLVPLHDRVVTLEADHSQASSDLVQTSDRADVFGMADLPGRQLTEIGHIANLLRPCSVVDEAAVFQRIQSSLS